MIKLTPQQAAILGGKLGVVLTVNPAERHGLVKQCDTVIKRHKKNTLEHRIAGWMKELIEGARY